jgi:hypothetical protein
MVDTIKKLWNSVKGSYHNYKSNPTAFKLFKIVIYIFVFIIGSVIVILGTFIINILYAIKDYYQGDSYQEYDDNQQRPQVIVIDRDRSYQPSQTEELFRKTHPIPRIRKPQVGVPREFRPPKPYFPRPKK